MNQTISNIVSENIITADKPCNLLNNGNLESADFDYSDFLDRYAHEDCTILAFYLHERFGFKIGVVRANDLNNSDDCGYETIVHQFAFLPNGLVLDARGIDTEAAMLEYYEEASLDDDEEWDFIVDREFCHETVEGEYSDHEENFNQFLSLLSAQLEK